ncbi:MAG TPA: SRPBCC domain-containing protein [Planctomycetota bacterium]|nr:SRPBCC domain-containing protein [Planctomycetota bacterium]
MKRAKPKLQEVRIQMYLRATPARVWKALTDPKELVRWYKKPLHVSAKKGAAWNFTSIDGKVLEVKPGKKLVHTFRFPFAKGEPWTRVTFLLEKHGRNTCLTLIHDRFQHGKQTREWVSGGWPFLISNLKSYLETRKPLQEGGYN